MSAAADLRVVEAVVEGGERTLTVGAWRFIAQDGEPEIADTELAPRLGMEVFRLRELSARHERAGHITPRVSRTVRETGGRPGMARFYTEADALFLVTRSDAPGAVTLTKEMIRVYLAVRRHLVAAESASSSLAPVRAAPEAPPARPGMRVLTVEVSETTYLFLEERAERMWLSKGYGASFAARHVLDAARSLAIGLGVA